MNAICLAIDGLQPSYLGVYGNSWLQTPTLDRLAVESFVFDQFHLDSPDWLKLYHSYWQGWHPLQGASPPADRPSLPELLSAQGVTSHLLTDVPEIADHPLTSRFGSLMEFDPPQSAEPADEIDGTHLAQCFARLVDWLPSVRQPFFLWCHLSGLTGPWDAPLEFRLRHVDEGDPEPPLTADVPCRLLEEDFDPDEVLGHAQAYAGQVELLDLCLSGLFEYLDSEPVGRDTALVFLSPQGFPLGEHRRVGRYDEALYGELVRLPLLVRFPNHAGQWPSGGARTQALVQPGDLWATLLDLWSVGDRPPSPWAASLLPLVREESFALRDRLVLTDGSGGRAIRTPAWYLLDTDPPELFAKPDDRWEVNNVFDRCGDVVERLRKALDEYLEHLHAGRLNELPPLEEVLCVGLE